jgi:hypothetical protein
VPLNPENFIANQPPTAKQLNTALYTYTPGSNFTPNGILFHANRPLLVEGLQTELTQGSNGTGLITQLDGSGNWKNFFDNTALFGGGADTLYNTASGRFNAGVAGSYGIAGTAGGHYIIWGFPCFGSTTNADGAGAILSVNNGGTVSGGKQLSSTTHDNCSYALDLVTSTSGLYTSLGGWCADASSAAYNYRYNLTDYSGETTRFTAFWCSTVANQIDVADVPVPPVWTDTSAVTSAILNNSAIVQPMNLLNAPPVLRVGTQLSTTITAGNVITIPLQAAQTDNYNAWNSGASTYTVPVTGVYLVHGYVYYAISAAGNVQAVINVNGTSIFGPAYQGVTSTNTGCQITRLLDLNVGDIVQLATYNNSSGNHLGADLSRLVLSWLGSTSVPNGLTWTPPNAGYRWQAGTSNADLVAAFQQHLTNDISFLLQRPYLLSYQSTVQTELSQDVFHVITMDTVKGIVHGSTGDPYGGWNDAENYYSAPVDGWYLVIAGFAQSALASGTASCLAAILQTPAGSQSPDWYQHISTTSTVLSPGAEAIGVYYLRAGDSVQPQYQQQDGGSFSTYTAAGNQSSFSVIWLCE